MKGRERKAPASKEESSCTFGGEKAGQHHATGERLTNT